MQQKGMRLVGLTGGIASGKSTVSKRFSDLGVEIIDADVLAREVVAPGSEGLQAVVEAFGEDILDATGALDRKKLGEIVFADPAARRTLEAITHPRIFRRFLEKTEDARKRQLPLAIYDAPLLIERQLHLMMDAVVVVWVPRAVQVQRLMERDGITHEAAEQRLAAQMPLDEKKAVADHVIDNSGTREQTFAQVDRLFSSFSAPAS